MIKVFSEQWFKKYNRVLCWFANSFLGEWIFNFHKFGHYLDHEIVDITPNSVCELIKQGKKKQTLKRHFFGRNEYSLRLQKVFYPIWITFHTWDLITRPIPQLNLGFDTLTVYPDAHPESTSVDGQVHYQGAETTWATIHSTASASSTQDTENYFVRIAGYKTGHWTNNWRTFLLFDTSALTSGATISAAVLSLYSVEKSDSQGITPNIDIYTSTPASNTELSTSDYSSYGITSQTGSPITYASWSGTGYNDFTFNATGMGNISKTSISKFSALNANYDVANSEPTNSSATNSYFYGYYSDNGSNKPKLVITYTAPVITRQPRHGFIHFNNPAIA